MLAAMLALVTTTAYAVAPGDEAIGFGLPDFHSGKMVTLADYAGQLVYLDFWASWCGPCVKSFPYYEDLYGRFGGEAFTIIAVNLDENSSDALRFLDRHPVSFPVVLDPRGETAAQWRISTMPSSYLIGPDQRVLRAWVGFKASHTKEIEDEIRAHLSH